MAVVGVHDHHVGDVIALHLRTDIVHGDEVEGEVQTGGHRGIGRDNVVDPIDAHHVTSVNEQPVFGRRFASEESGQGGAGFLRAGVGQQSNLVAVAAQRLCEHGRVRSCIGEVGKIGVGGVADDQRSRLGRSRGGSQDREAEGGSQAGKCAGP